MVIFRENTEDIYAGIEFEAGSPENEKFKRLFKEAFPKLYGKIRFPDTSGIGIKAISQEGNERAASQEAELHLDAEQCANDRRYHGKTEQHVGVAQNAVLLQCQSSRALIGNLEIGVHAGKSLFWFQRKRRSEAVWRIASY